MISNRESARRSRMRKQKHLDEFDAQMAELKKENNQIITSVNITSQHYMNIEAENLFSEPKRMSLATDCSL
ncbi:G-box binding factor 3 [Prunus dulcis]|uniref:G-box binding factor 3 n=1 Tax=Prunus dulcis TaxID=3755 RepID=A0A4Y1RYE0_PRUDU|nr:G-box binding factor 3 [Prunus dulcis]